MSLDSLQHLTAELPEDADAVRRLVKFLEERLQEPQSTIVSVDRIRSIANPSNSWALATMIRRCIEAGVLEEFVRVESTALGGIEDFPTLQDVPVVVFDPRIGANVHIRPEQIGLFYRLQK